MSQLCHRLILNHHLQQWQKYWDDDKIFMVEKSPPSFLKIHLLRNLFRAAKSVKFIILMKVISYVTYHNDE